MAPSSKSGANGYKPWWISATRELGFPIVICAVLLWGGKVYLLDPAAAKESRLVDALTSTTDTLAADRRKQTEIAEMQTVNIRQLTETVTAFTQAFELLDASMEKQTSLAEDTNACMQRAEDLMAPVPEERRKFYASQTKAAEETVELLKEVRDSLVPDPNGS